MKNKQLKKFKKICDRKKKLKTRNHGGRKYRYKEINGIWKPLFIN